MVLMMPAMISAPGRGIVSAFACNCRSCSSDILLAFICCAPELVCSNDSWQLGKLYASSTDKGEVSKS